MANEPNNPQAKHQPQMIPLTKIHDLPGVFIPKQPDKNYGGLVTSIQASGVKEAVILRLREDGEYQLVTGYRRRRASELAKKQDIPAYVYEMSLQDAIAYHKQVKMQANAPIPGKLVDTPAKVAATPSAPGKENKAVPVPKEKQDPTAVPSDKPKEGEKPVEAAAPATPGKEDKAAPVPKEKQDSTAAPGDKTKEDEKPVEAAAPATPGKEDKAAPAPKEKQDPTAAPGDKPKEGEKPVEAVAPTTPGKEDKAAPAPKEKQNPTAASGDKPKEGEKPVEAAAPVAPGKEDKAAPGSKEKQDPTAVPATSGKDDKVEPAPKEKQNLTAAPGDKPKEGEKTAEAAPAVPGKGDKAPASTPKEKPGNPATTPTGKPKEDEKPTKTVVPPIPVKEGKTVSDPKEKPAAGPGKDDQTPKPTSAVLTGPAAAGPAGTAITQVFEQRLDPPDEKALKSLPVPKEGESFFITLHPAYLEKSKFNTFSVDTSSENYKELLKSVELVGIKDPVLTRINPNGGLEILSGQRRHLAAKELNYPVPAIIQKIDDDDAKIIVADGNLHRDKISTYDLSRALRMKMEGMKQKSGRRKKGEIKADELDSDEKLAKEMGMSVSKLNRIIRLSEASKDVCDRVDDNSLPLSIASAISFLKPQNQEHVLYLSDMGYKLSNDRIERMKKVEKSGKLDDRMMRDILDDKDLAPKQVVPPAPAPTPSTTPPVTTPTMPTVANGPTIPSSPDVKPTTPTNDANQVPPVAVVPEAPDTGKEKPPVKETDIFKGEQERPDETKIVLRGDRLRKYFPDVSMTPREIEESIYDALEDRRQRQEKQKQKEAIFKKGGPTR